MPNFEDIDKGQVSVPEHEPGKFSFRVLLAFLGPGWLISMAYLDPGNLAGDLDAAREGGYRLLWILLLATFAGWIMQCLAARLGVVTQKDMAEMARERYNKPTAILLWVLTEIAIIGCDIQEVLGSAIAMKILFGIPLYAGAIITMFDTFTFLFIHVFGVRKLEAFFAFLVAVMAICFYINMFIVLPPAADVFLGFVPYVPPGAGSATIGLVGAVIMPHNLYLHSALVLSRKIDLSTNVKIRDANMYFAIEAALSLFVSFLINLAVISVFAYWSGEDKIDGLESAGNAMNTFGAGASAIWAVGLLASGQSSTMTGTYAGQFVMQGFLDFKMVAWKRVLVTRSIALVPALCIAFLEAPETVDNWLNILQSIQLPFALIPLLKFTACEDIMGDFVTPKWLQWVCWIIAVILVVMNIYLLVPPSGAWWVYFVISIAGLIYLGVMGFILWLPVTKKVEKRTNTWLNGNELEENLLKKPSSSSKI